MPRVIRLCSKKNKSAQADTTFSFGSAVCVLLGEVRPPAWGGALEKDFGLAALVARGRFGENLGATRS